VWLDPDLLDAHQLLGEWYGKRKMLDAALGHWREVARLLKQPPPGIDLDGVRKDVERRRQEWDSQASKTDLLNQARLAFTLGLPEKAFDVLRSTGAAHGPEALRLQLQLLLWLGRPQQARALLTSEDLGSAAGLPVLEPLPGLPAEAWLNFLSAAATGNYDDADAALAGLLDRSAARREVRAELNALGGLLALERGEPPAALRYFEESLAQGGNDFAARPLAVVMRQRLRGEGR